VVQAIHSVVQGQQWLISKLVANLSYMTFCLKKKKKKNKNKKQNNQTSSSKWLGKWLSQ
jgi:hypothetical protein